MEILIGELEAHGSGLLITVDEIDAELDELVILASVYQHFIRENRRVALLMAGLPGKVSSLFNNTSLSFMRRSEMVHLGRIEDFEIEAALKKTIELGGRFYSGASLDYAVKSIAGFPYLMQLVGFLAWDEHPENEGVTAADFENGVTLARETLCSGFFEAIYRELSARDVDFLEAMAVDDRESRASDIADRLGWTMTQVTQHRHRLSEAGVIGGRRQSIAEFEMPFFREFVLEKADSTA